MSSYKIAAIQLYCEPLAPEANHKRACDFIRKAAAKGAQLAVLPEFHLNAWEPSHPEWAIQAAQYRKYVESYCGDADANNPLFRNVAYFIDNQGKILGSYQKKNLWHSERGHLTSAVDDLHPVIDTPIGKVGLLACWDLAFPEAFRELIAGGAETIIIPAYWTFAEASGAGMRYNARCEQLVLNSMVVSRCFENTCAIVFVNAGNAVPKRDDKKNICVGESQISVPFIGALEKLGDAEGMIIADIDTQILKDAEDNYKVREDMAKSNWHYVYRHSTIGKNGISATT
ncbi:putative carbon-nitrogen family [Phaeomoniella chlamydospora]|uniref:Putative carbon-nitrogen family n=1 Tax=Phaeomoniella chlamydospora TaxID=158046 RepID=A0A0G2G8B3_PHACM|nr:putative carbon-nitrogen family [Phaeomoniella chlamydospora]